MKARLKHALSVEEAVHSERVATGVVGLDTMLGGGLPLNRFVLVCGGPGSGKTIFGVQFLFSGVTEYDEAGLYITLDESLAKLRKDMAAFGWNLERLEKDRKLGVVDVSPIRTIPAEVKVGNFSIRKAGFSMLSLIHIIKTRAQEIRAKRVVIDPITMFE